MKNKIMIFMAVAFSLFSYTLGSQTSQRLPVPQKEVAQPIMAKFFEVAASIKTICAKDPNHHLCRRLQASKSLNSNIDTQAIVNIAHTLKQDSRVNALAQKITDRLNPNLVHKCFVNGDKKSCAQFERHLKYKTLRCGGIRCLWGGKKRTCQAAAFTAAVNCIDCGK